MNCKYAVVVLVWDDDKKAQVKKFAGMFERFVDAKLFADAYGVRYCATPEIVELGTFLAN